MTGIFHSKPTVFFLIVLTIYFIFGLINLQQLPIAWTDEVMHLDPALQWHKHGIYKGFLWPNAGSNELFLSYPPLVEWFDIASLYVLPLDIFWLRLPFLLVQVFTVILLFRIVLKLTKDNAFLAFFIATLFLLDKVVFEISRSMRVEVLESFLIALLFYLHLSKSRTWLRGMVLGLLLVAHLKMWPLVFFYLLYLRLVQTKIREMAVLIVVSLVPLFLFFIGIDFQFASLYQQMFVQSGKHVASGAIFQKIAAFLYGRFWPVYKEQPWFFVLFWSGLVLLVTRIWRSRGKDMAALIFTGTSLVWLFILAPFYRYWPPLYFCLLVGLAGLPSVQKWFDQKRIRIFAIAFLPLISISFFSRHILALAQRSERDPGAALSWLSGEIDTSKRTLVVGEGIAFFLTEHKNLDYGMDMYPQNLHLEQYEKVYFWSRDTWNFNLKNTYHPAKGNVPKWASGLVNSATYDGLHLYEIRNKTEWETLTGKYKNDY